MRVRHCSATVSDGRSLHEATAYPGGKAQAIAQYVVSQETGHVGQIPVHPFRG